MVVAIQQAVAGPGQTVTKCQHPWACLNSAGLTCAQKLGYRSSDLATNFVRAVNQSVPRYSEQALAALYAISVTKLMVTANVHVTMALWVILERIGNVLRGLTQTSQPVD